MTGVKLERQNDFIDFAKTLKAEAVCSSKTTVSIYKSTWWYNLENQNPSSPTWKLKFSYTINYHSIKLLLLYETELSEMEWKISYLFYVLM